MTVDIRSGTLNRQTDRQTDRQTRRRRKRQMRVLVACEESQAVCTAFRERGHEAYSCDLQECSGGHPEWHINGDVLQVLPGNMTFTTSDGQSHEIIGHWDLVIAHPPCTYLSNAGAARLFPRKGELNKDRFIEGLKGKLFFMAFWYYGFFGCGKMVIENPIPSGVYELPPHTQVIQPYEYGHPYSKKTYLWEFGVPKLEPTDVVKPLCSWVSGGSKRADGTPRSNQGTVIRDGKRRSKTFPGIAQAMAEQWG